MAWPRQGDGACALRVGPASWLRHSARGATGSSWELFPATPFSRASLLALLALPKMTRPRQTLPGGSHLQFGRPSCGDGATCQFPSKGPTLPLPPTKQPPPPQPLRGSLRPSCRSSCRSPHLWLRAVSLWPLDGRASTPARMLTHCHLPQSQYRLCVLGEGKEAPPFGTTMRDHVPLPRPPASCPGLGPRRPGRSAPDHLSQPCAAVR